MFQHIEAVRNHEDVLAEPVYTMADNVKRFRKFGKIITRVARSETGETAKIGKIERDDKDTVYLIFYPDGTFDRFETGAKVEYRDGWTGPDLTTSRYDDDLAEMLLNVEEELKGEESKPIHVKSEIALNGKKVAGTSSKTSTKKTLSPEARDRKRAADRARYAAKKAKTLH